MNTNTEIQIVINNETRNIQWTEFASMLTSYDCGSSTSCATEIASSASLDIAWMLLNAFLVLLVIVGHSMIELGSMSTRQRIVTKNIGELCLSALCFYAVGFGFAATKGNEFIGGQAFALQGSAFYTNDKNGKSSAALGYASFFYEWTLVAVCVSIVSGAVAERIQVVPYLVYTFTISTIVFPLITHWSTLGWASPYLQSDRFLSVGVIDFAGAGAICVAGGVMACIACLLIGPRKGRFSEDGISRQVVKQSEALVCIGTVFVWIGWYGVCCGSTFAIDGDAAIVTASIVVNVTLSASAGGIVSMLIGKILNSYYPLDPALLHKGVLIGLVSITAGCGTVEGPFAILIGSIGGFLYHVGMYTLDRLQLDDVVDTIVIHLFGGMWSLLASGLFSAPDRYQMAYGLPVEQLSCGSVYTCNEHRINQLLANTLFALVLLGWTGTFALLTFLPLKYSLCLRRIAEDMKEYIPGPKASILSEDTDLLASDDEERLRESSTGSYQTVDSYYLQRAWSSNQWDSNDLSI